jgi:hypothetical protein
MRWATSFLIAAVVALIAAGCNLLQPDSSSTGAGGTGGSQCPQTSTCMDCTTCALNGACATLYSTCEQSSDCMAIDTCFNQCGDDASCKQSCFANDPAGMSDYQGVLDCVDCTECPTACAGLCSSQ